MTPVQTLSLALCCLASGSCTQLFLNASQSSEQRRPASNDAMTGTAEMAGGLVRSTALGAIRQPYTTAKLAFVTAWHRPREVLSANMNIPLRIKQLPHPTETPGTLAFEAMLDRHDFPLAETGNLTWLVDGPGFFPELDRQLEQARRSIDLQVFIFDNDDIAVRYADKLKGRASQVKTRVLFDDLGSTFAHTTPPDTPAPAGFSAPASIARHLRADSKVRVRRSPNPWFVCDHTKLLVFDDRTAIIGGMNIGREYYSEWHDLMVKVEGPIVPSLAREFDRAWRKAGPWGDLALFGTPRSFRKPPPIQGGTPLRLLRTDPAEGRYEILDSTIMAIRASKKRIWIQNPYLAHDDVERELADAARRGVDVRVILPARGDSTIMDVGNLSSARFLIQAGAKVYSYPRMTHMKVLLCDGWGSVGSANLDTLSMRINRELNLSFASPELVRSLERAVFTPDFRISKRMTFEETQSLLSPLAEAIADQL